MHSGIYGVTYRSFVRPHNGSSTNIGYASFELSPADGAAGFSHYVGKIRWKLLVWVRVGRVYLLRPSEKYRLLFGLSDDLKSSLHPGILD